MRKFAVVAGLILLATFTAKAQDTSKFQVDGGFLYARALTDQPSSGVDNCYGGYGNATYFFVGGLGATANFGGCSFSDVPAGDKASVFEYTFGPTYAFRHSKWTEPFVQALFGGTSASITDHSGTFTYNGFTMNLGGGLDVRVTDMVAIRVFDVNYLNARIDGRTLNGIELKFGVTLRFGGHS